MNRNGAALLALLVLSGLAVGIGVWGAAGEMRAFHVEGGDRMDRALALASKETGPGLAVATRRASLLDCGTALTDGAGFDTLLPANQASILTGCAELARDVAVANPTQSYAYFTAAAVAARNGDWPVVSEQLQLSYLTAPDEQWLAEWRVNLVEDHRDNLDPAILSLHERDLRVMAASWAGAPARRDVTGDRHLTAIP